MGSAVSERLSSLHLSIAASTATQPAGVASLDSVVLHLLLSSVPSFDFFFRVPYRCRALQFDFTQALSAVVVCRARLTSS